MDRFGNPFSISVDREGCERPDPLINMATGVAASEEVRGSYQKSSNFQRDMKKSFRRLYQNENSKSKCFSNKTVKRLNLKTFVTMASSNARVKKHTNNRIEEDRDLFAPLSSHFRRQNCGRGQLLTHELSSISQVIANNDGPLPKTNKAQALHDLEVYVRSLQNDKLMQVIRKSSTAVFVDHMACVQKLTSRSGISPFLEKVIQCMLSQISTTLSIPSKQVRREGVETLQILQKLLCVQQTRYYQEI